MISFPLSVFSSLFSLSIPDVFASLIADEPPALLFVLSSYNPSRFQIFRVPSSTIHFPLFTFRGPFASLIADEPSALQFRSQFLKSEPIFKILFSIFRFPLSAVRFPFSVFSFQSSAFSFPFFPLSIFHFHNRLKHRVISATFY